MKMRYHRKDRALRSARTFHWKKVGVWVRNGIGRIVTLMTPPDHGSSISL